MLQAPSSGLGRPAVVKNLRRQPVKNLRGAKHADLQVKQLTKFDLGCRASVARQRLSLTSSNRISRSGTK
jgi:hypothetical protein